MELSREKRKPNRDGHGELSSKRARIDKKLVGQSIQPGDAGIWATCTMKKEAKSVGDLRDLFNDYASKLYGTCVGELDDEKPDNEVGDIEQEINKELARIRHPNAEPLFKSTKLDTQCLIFFRTRSPVEPVPFVHKICKDIADGYQPRNLRYVKRITPITACEKATAQGLDAVAKRVLAPYFHCPDHQGKKFAIRPSIRNNQDFSRDEVIRSVAAIVGPGHKVDLHGYDLLILVEIYKNIVGMSVVESDFEVLRRFNIDELRQIRTLDKSKPKSTPKAEDNVEATVCSAGREESKDFDNST